MGFRAAMVVHQNTRCVIIIIIIIFIIIIVYRNRPPPLANFYNHYTA
jgi:hypothetical protein